MPVGFGFSAGDFIAALKLVGTVIDALRDGGEAGLAYRELVRELYSLETALLHVKRLDGEEIPQAEVISLRQVAAQCQSTIDDFWEKVQKYQPHLGPTHSLTPIKSGWMKIRWAVCKNDDLAKFKASLAGHTEAINILLNTIAISKMTLQDQRQDRQNYALASMIQSSYCQCMRKLCSISDGVARSWAQGKQLLEMMDKVIRTNLEVFKIVLQIQAVVTQIPGQIQRQQPVYLIDALGKHSPFHLEFIRSAEAFKSVLKANFRNIGDAAEKIDRGEFVIQDSALKMDMDLSQEWEHCFSPGQCVHMYMTYHAAVCAACGSEERNCDFAEAICHACGITFSRKEHAIIDRPIVALMTNRAQGVGATANLEPQHLLSAPPNSLKTKRREEGFKSVRGCRRIRIYTPASTEEFSILLATNKNVTEWRRGGGDANQNRVSGHCYYEIPSTI
ncbi:hypothetical protein GJ744_000776 [Endocarpon pusillum]|uniref:Fungal N-terminal domain-containing protein n=1 Tax=Endocarpon pusillum TaxID=364733 RepID=A0A8H7DZW5_9EURO|nr:hypothetical protein GJ744_000776 [Endocarpon pusillum]